MCKKIKKGIKRSMPLFVIFSLIISSTVVGLVFNLDFSNIKFSDLSVPEVEAQTGDTATTSVEVLNAAPELVGNVQEWPGSTSTSPINVGGKIRFLATSTDAESDDFYLIVCETAGVTANNGTWPTCNGGVTETFCTSTVATAGNQATCTYDGVADPGGEEEIWYAYVCDDHATQAYCSVVNQGAAPNTGLDSSPFYVNHAPAFTAITTTDNNNDPGTIGATSTESTDFEVTATVTDSDVMGGADLLTLYICGNTGFSTSTGCLTSEFCKHSSTTPDIHCGFATGTPAIDGIWNYQAYVMDEHYLVAAANPRAGTYTVNNVNPVMGAITFHDGDDIVLNMKGTAEVSASSTATITDNNGCTDISLATSTFYLSSTSSLENCTAHDNDCYQIASAGCMAVPGTCTNAEDANITYICSTTLAYHTTPTDGVGNPNAGDNWLAAIGATDDDSVSGASTTATGIEIATLEAMDVTENDIDFGAIRGGQDSGDANATTTVINFGNCPLDSDLIGDDMDKAGASEEKIFALNQEFSTSTFTYGDGIDLASTAPAYTFDVDVVKATSSDTVSDEIYWGMQVPAGTTSGNYYGTTTITAALDDDAW